MNAQTIHAHIDWPAGVPPYFSNNVPSSGLVMGVSGIHVANPSPCQPMGVFAVVTIYMLCSMNIMTERVGFQCYLNINGTRAFTMSPFALINMQNGSNYWFQRVSETFSWSWVLPPSGHDVLDVLVDYDFNLTNGLVPPPTHNGLAGFTGSMHTHILAVS